MASSPVGLSPTGSVKNPAHQGPWGWLSASRFASQRLFQFNVMTLLVDTLPQCEEETDLSDLSWSRVQPTQDEVAHCVWGVISWAPVSTLSIPDLAEVALKPHSNSVISPCSQVPAWVFLIACFLMRGLLWFLIVWGNIFLSLSHVWDIDRKSDSVLIYPLSQWLYGPFSLGLDQSLCLLISTSSLWSLILNSAMNTARLEIFCRRLQISTSNPAPTGSNLVSETVKKLTSLISFHRLSENQ